MTKKPQPLESKAILFFLIAWQAWREGGGGGFAMGELTYPHRDQRSTFLFISDLKQSEVGVLFYSNLLIV